MGSRFKEALKSLCCNNGWSYAVFWRFNRQNFMLLTLEDAYFDGQVGTVIDKMIRNVHMLGEGIIGQAAFTGKHQWMFSDSYRGVWSPTGSVDNQDVFQDKSEFHQQFSSGIKTIAVISVGSQGVVQFGSTQKILERLDFVDHIKSSFQQLGSVDRLIISGNAPMDLYSELYDPSGVVASVITSRNSFPSYGNTKPLHSGSGKELIRRPQSAIAFPQPSSPFTPEFHNGNMTPLISNSSFQLKNQLQMVGAEAQVILSTPNMQLPQVLSHFTGSSADNSAARNPSVSSWSSECPTLTSFEQQMLSGVVMQDTFSANARTPVSCRNTFQNFQGNATSTSLYDSNGLPDDVTNIALPEVNKPTGYDSREQVGFQHPLFLSTEGELPQGSTSFCTFPGEFRLSHATTALSKSETVNSLSQWTAKSLEQGNNGISAPLNNNLSQAVGVASTLSGLVGGDVCNGIPINQSAISLQNSITDSIKSLSTVYDGNENFNLPMQQPVDNGLFDSLGMDFGQIQGSECWDDILLPVGNGSCSGLDTATSECISELDFGCMAVPPKGFLTELGLEQILGGPAGNANSDTKPSSEDQLSSTTITRTKSASVYGNQVHLAGLSCMGGNVDEFLPECKSEKMTVHRNQKETVLRSTVGVRIDDSYSINAESDLMKQIKKPEEPVKATKKRARPGESSRPRPKDRQQIQDRVKELREIVPNGAKCSIDSLLDRTIKHMLFLQSVTKYADKLKQAYEPKMIVNESGVVLKDNPSGGGGGATWAFEVGGQTMVCPIIVEDLSASGQMLVEMLCEERGIFLEIADIIRGFGLTILKGVMELRGEKIWARFVIEANRDITRMDIFLSLVQLLQQASTSEISSGSQPNKDVESGVPLFMNYQKSPIALPVGLADPLH